MNNAASVDYGLERHLFKLQYLNVADEGRTTEYNLAEP